MRTRIWLSACFTTVIAAISAGCEDAKQQATATDAQTSQHERLPIEGRWRDGEFDLIVADGQLTTLKNGEDFEYPNGRVTYLEPGIVRLGIDADYTEKFYYEWDGERLAMVFQRSGPVYCEPIDDVARRSAEQLKPNKSRLDNPLPRPESEIESP